MYGWASSEKRSGLPTWSKYPPIHSPGSTARYATSSFGSPSLCWWTWVRPSAEFPSRDCVTPHVFCQVAQCLLHDGGWELSSASVALGAGTRFIPLQCSSRCLETHEGERDASSLGRPLPRTTTDLAQRPPEARYRPLVLATRLVVDQAQVRLVGAEDHLGDAIQQGRS